MSRAARHPSLRAGALLVAGIALAAALSLVWTPYPPADIDVAQRLLPSSPAHWLGTDPLGRDIVSQLMAGARASILAGAVAVGAGLLAGVALGLAAAAAGGWLDQLLMRAADFLFAFPAILSAILLAAWLGPGLASAILAIAILNVAVFARIARAAAASVYPREFILAAQLAGSPAWRIAVAHVLPNIAAVLIVQVSIQFATAILAEAALAYLGLGAQPPQASWGRMLSEAQAHLFQAPALAIYPGCAIAMAVLGLNLLGDGLRDVLDVREA